MAFIRCGGRFGNQMFQTAACYAHSKRVGERCYTHAPALVRFPNIAKYITFCEDMPTDARYMQKRQKNSLFWCNDDLPPRDVNLRLVGCFESVRYFYDCEDDIRDMYWTPQSAEANVGVHIRRTDFLNSTDKHLELGLNWYWRALSLLNADNVIVCSDDINWCRRHIQWPHMIFSDIRNSFLDWCRLNSCKDIIMANSTYSWWAGYLGHHDRVIYPRRWFKNQTESELFRYVNGWIILDN